MSKAPTLYINNQRVSKSGKAPLFFKHQIGGKSISLSTDFRVEPEKWNQEKQTVEGDETLTRNINQVRETWKVHYQTAVDDNLNALEVKENFNTLITKKISPVKKMQKYSLGFYDLFDEYQEKNRNQYSNDYLRKYKTVKKTLFDLYPNIKPSELSHDLLDEYHDQLIEKGLSNNTIRDHFKILKVIAKYGRRIGMTIPPDVEDVKIKSYSPQPLIFSEDELVKLENVEIESESERQVKDWFLFRCYTGVRYSDLQHINIVGLKGENLEFHIQKQQKSHTIPLGEKAKTILMTYRQFSGYSNQHENKIIKKLCERAQIDLPVRKTRMVGNKVVEITKPKYDIVSGHDARRIFARLMIERGHSLYKLSRYLGHKSESITAKYVGISHTDFKGLGM